MTDATLLEELKQLIESSHQKPEDDQLQEATIQKCFDYIASFPVDKHLFCDADGYYAGVHALILFSFPDSDALTWYKQKISSYLNNCQKCIFMFHQGKAKLREKFLVARGLDYESVSKFLEMISIWESSRLVPTLNAAVQEISSNSGNTMNSSLILNEKVMLALIECLCGPGMLRVDSELRSVFSAVFKYLVESNTPFKLSSKLTPGVIYLLFEGSDLEKKWALDSLMEVSKNKKIEPIEFNAALEEEYEIHLYAIQSPNFYSDETCIRFWRNLIPIINACTKDTILQKLQAPSTMSNVQQYFSYKLVPLGRVITNQIMSYQKQSLPYILRAFNAFLVRLSNTFWTITSPETFSNFLDTIFGNPYYLKFMIELNNNQGQFKILENDLDANLNDLLYWINALFNSLADTQQQTAGTRIADWFIKLSTDKQILIPSFTKSLLISIACDLLTKCLDLQVMLHNINFTVDLLVRVEARNLVDKHSGLFISTSFDLNSEYNNDSNFTFLRNSCIKLVSHCIQFDILNFSQNSYNSYKGEPSSLAPFSSLMWEKITQSSFKGAVTRTASQNFLMTSLLSALKGIPGILLVKTDKKNAGQYEVILKYLNSLLSMFLVVDQAEVRAILRNADALDGLWSCILSPESEISQSATSILYEAYDSTGRYEGIVSILQENFEFSLNSITKSLSRIILCGFFEPCPRAVRVMMDVINAANDPMKGILANQSKFAGSSNKEFMQKFWNQCWDFLVFIYKGTLGWATAYHAKDLIEFTRDTLDLSHFILRSFKNTTTFLLLDQPESKGKIEKLLFQKILDSFKSMLVWLRLSDAALLKLCVDLIFKTVDLATELNLAFNDEVIELLAKYGCKAKKFNNKLTLEQVTEILSRAKSFNEELVDRIIAESEEYKREKNLVHVISPTASGKSSISPTPTASSRLGTPKTTSAPTPSELSKIDRLKQSIRQSRNSTASRVGSSMPPVIHPPSKPGFHSKKAKKVDSDSDDESGSDSNEAARELFMKSKKGKTKTTLMDKLPHLKSSNLKRPTAATMIDEQKRKEMNMRKRLNVSMNPLYKNILNWSYSRTAEFPDLQSHKYRPVVDSFANPQEYQKVFEPLLLLECWQSICQSRQLSQERPFELLVGTRSSVDNFFDVYTSVKKSLLSDRKIGESDLLVLAYIKDSTDAASVSQKQMQESPLNCFAKVMEIKSVNSDYADVTLRVLPSNNPMVPLFTPQTSLVAMKVIQMTTIEREYSSLFGLPWYDLMSSIIRANPSHLHSIEQDLIQKMIKSFNVNKSQAAAIAGSVHSKGFSLIQGPPGTGKTKTILGIVGYILSASDASNKIEIPGSAAGVKKPALIEVAPIKQKILICAPSNAAVDELVLRLRSNIKDSNGKEFKPSVVRLGRSDAINAAVKDLTLEEQVDKELGKREDDTSVPDSSIRGQHNQCLQERDQIRQQLNQDNLPEDKAVQLQIKLREVLKRKNELGRKLDEQREKQYVSYRNKEIEKRNIQYKILSQANIICSTLSGSAHSIIKDMNLTCDTVIIDEACQCTELSAIIPLRYGCERCIMVGDPNQLPPTVLSQAAASFNYEQSLFVRMQRTHPNSVYLLNVQYRMHPDISRFPSKEFYDSRLIDGDGMAVLNKRKWHSDYPLSPYRFFNIVGKQEQDSRTKSFFNTVEARVALELVQKLEGLAVKNHDSIDGKIGIISPYKEQISKIKGVFVRHYGRPILNSIDFNTVDGFQGQEKEVIIMSCVRANGASGVGFLADVRRMNVGLTRARTTLWVLGHKESLCRNKVWGDLIDDAESRHFVTKAFPGFLKNIREPTYNDSQLKKITEVEGGDELNSKSKPKKKKKKSQKSHKQVELDYGEGKQNSTDGVSTEAAKSESGSKGVKRKGSSLFNTQKSKMGKSGIMAKTGPKPTGRPMPTIYSSNKPLNSNDIPIPKRSGKLPLQQGEGTRNAPASSYGYNRKVATSNGAVGDSSTTFATNDSNVNKSPGVSALPPSNNIDFGTLTNILSTLTSNNNNNISPANNTLPQAGQSMNNISNVTPFNPVADLNNNAINPNLAPLASVPLGNTPTPPGANPLLDILSNINAAAAQKPVNFNGSNGNKNSDSNSYGNYPSNVNNPSHINNPSNYNKPSNYNSLGDYNNSGGSSGAYGRSSNYSSNSYSGSSYTGNSYSGSNYNNQSGYNSFDGSNARENYNGRGSYKNKSKKFSNKYKGRNNNNYENYDNNNYNGPHNGNKGDSRGGRNQGKWN